MTGDSDNWIGNHVFAGESSPAATDRHDDPVVFAILMLPRINFHVGVVENHTPAELKRARWLFLPISSRSTCS